MSSFTLYRVVKKNGIYDILQFDSNQNTVYEDLCLAISTKDLFKFLDILTTVDITYTLLNQQIFICDATCCYTNCIALNLCHFAVFNDCKEILKELLKQGGDLSKKTIEVTVSQNQRTFIEKDSLIDLIVHHFDEPIKYFQNIFDGYIETADLGNTYEFKFDFSILYPSSKMEKHEPQCERQMCVLNGIINSSYDIYSDECGLLQHPLIEAYLSCKWSHYRNFFYILVVLHVLFVTCLSAVALIIVENFDAFSKIQNITISSHNIHSYDDRIDVVLLTIKVLNSFLLFLGFLLFTHALIQMCFIPFRKLLFEFEVLLNLFTSVFALLNCAFGITVPLHLQIKFYFKFMYTINSLIILPAWIDLMLIIGRIPSLGCYSLMFTTVMKNFLKVMVSFIFLLIGFSLSFSLMFPWSELFNNPIGAILRTIVMMIGEFNYAETFSHKEPFLNGVSKFIFVLFVISCSIILMNLTQGIAVNDIKLLHEISQIIRLEKETRFLYEFESIFTQQIMTSNPVLRKIKNRLYDKGTIKTELTITKENRQNISKQLLAKLVQTYKPTRTIWNRKLSHPRFQFKCLPSRYEIL